MAWRKVPGMPKGRVSAYSFFIKACREEVRNLGQRVVYLELSRSCSQRWQAMSLEEKAPFLNQSELDKRRFVNEMKKYFSEHPEISCKGKWGKVKRKHTKDPNKPRRYLTPFFWFSCDERAKIHRMYPCYTVAEVSKELGRLWKEADPKTREMYLKISARDKERYLREMGEYNEKKKTVHQATMSEAVPEVKKEEEDEERESEFDEYDEDKEKEVLLRMERAIGCEIKFD